MSPSYILPDFTSFPKSLAIAALLPITTTLLFYFLQHLLSNSPTLDLSSYSNSHPNSWSLKGKKSQSYTYRYHNRFIISTLCLTISTAQNSCIYQIRSSPVPHNSLQLPPQTSIPPVPLILFLFRILLSFFKSHNKEIGKIIKQCHSLIF